MIKRATSDTELIRNRFPNESKKFSEKILDLQPLESDLSGAVDGLLRLQFIYKIKSEDFSMGIIDGVKTRRELSTHDMFVIAQEALNRGDKNYFAKEYLELTRKRIRNGHDADNEVERNDLLSDLLKHLVTCYIRLRDFQEALETLDELLNTFPGEETFVSEAQLSILKGLASKDKLHKEINPYSDFYVKDGKFSKTKEDILYSQICRGNVTKSSSELAILKCRYVSNSPFSILSPFKVEEANLDPYIVIFIDVIADSEIEYFKNVTKESSERATVQSKDLSIVQTKNRVAQLHWFKRKHKITARISRRVEVR